MPALFADLSRAWESLAESLAAPHLLSRWQALEPSLRDCPTLASVAEASRGRGGTARRDDDEVLRSLLRLATDDDDARLAALHVLAPGLTQLAKAYATRWGWEESQAMVAAAALERIVNFGDRRQARPAANIVLGVRHDLFELGLREDSRSRVLGRRVPLRDELPAAERRAAGEELLGIVGEGVRTGAITRRGARLIVLHRIYGLSTRELAAAEGRDAASVRKYRNRAEAALADVAEAVA